MVLLNKYTLLLTSPFAKWLFHGTAFIIFLIFSEYFPFDDAKRLIHLEVDDKY